VLKTMDRASVLVAAGINRRSLERWLFNGVPSHASREQVLTELACEHAAAGLRRRGIAVPRELKVALHLYTQISDER
jgi:hypothetical protein